MFFKTSMIEDALPGIKKDILKYLPAKVFGMLMNLFLVPLYTNLLLPEEYGLYGISIGFLSFIAIIFSDWVGLSGLRFFQEHFNTNNIKPYFSTLLFLITSNLLLMYLFIFFFFEKLTLFFNIPGHMVFLVALLIIPVAFRALMFQILRAQIKPLTYTIVVILNQITTIGFAYFFIKYMNMGAEGILMGMALSIGTVDIIMLFLSGLGRHSSIKLVKKDTLQGFYKYGIPIAASSMGMWGITQSNKFVLQHFKGSFYNGLAGVGYNLTYSLIFPLFAVITLAAIPRIIKLYEEGKDVKPVISRLSGFFILIFTPVVFLIAVYANELVTLMSNQKYSDSAIIIPFLAVSAFLYGLTDYTVIQYHLAKKTYIQTCIRLSPAVLGIVASILLIPHFEGNNVLYAIGFANVITNAVYFILSLMVKMKNLHWEPPYKFIRVVFWAILLSSLVLLIFKHFSYLVVFSNSYIKIAAFLIAYIFVVVKKSKDFM